MPSESQLAAILRKEGVVSAANLEHALAHQRESGSALAEWLIAQGLISEGDLFFLLSRHLRVPAIPRERLAHLTLAPELRRRIPREMAETCLIVPLDYDPGPKRLSVVMCDPSDLRTLERLRRAAQVDSVSAYLARRTDILNTIKTIYATNADQSAGELQTPDPGQSAARGFSGMAASTDALESAETGVEVIPGKVSLDASLVREIAKLPREKRRQTPQRSVPPTMAGCPPPIPEAAGSSASAPTLKIRLSPRPPDLDQSQAVGRRTDTDADVTPEIVRDERQRDLLEHLLDGVSAMAVALEQRARPGASRVDEYGRLAGLLGLELRMRSVLVTRMVLAAQLYGLDEALRREVGSEMRPDVASAFSEQPSAPGGLSARMRRLGRHALLPHGVAEAETTLAAQAVQFVADFVALRERDEGPSDSLWIVERLRDSGADSTLATALTRVLKRIGEPVKQTNRSASGGEDR